MEVSHMNTESIASWARACVEAQGLWDAHNPSAASQAVLDKELRAEITSLRQSLAACLGDIAEVKQILAEVMEVRGEQPNPSNVFLRTIQQLSEQTTRPLLTVVQAACTQVSQDLASLAVKVSEVNEAAIDQHKELRAELFSSTSVLRNQLDTRLEHMEGVVRESVANSKKSQDALTEAFEKTRIWHSTTQAELQSLHDAVMSLRRPADQLTARSKVDANLTARSIGPLVKPHTEVVTEIVGKWSISEASCGRLLATSGDDGTLKFYDLERHRVVGTLRFVNPSEECRAPCVAFSPDSRRIAVGYGHDVCVFNVESGQLNCVLRGHADDVYSVRWSTDGQHIASGSSDRSVRIWQGDTGELVHVLEHATQVPLAFDISKTLNKEFVRSMGQRFLSMEEMWRVVVRMVTCMCGRYSELRSAEASYPTTRVKCLVFAGIQQFPLLSPLVVKIVG
eukprot:c13917_g1_i2.p1 GENE.c13917_g1_i2~~c13917_g1_i2.p1  ORF type:complete len:452 (+),score=76.69 c13917_g1_i2:28-1383(+)